MNSKNTIFLKQSKPLDFILWMVSISSWKFLAVTTSLAIVGAAGEFIATQFPNHFNTAMIVCVMIFYVIIDLGIVPMLKFYWNFKDTQNQYEKKFINVIFFFIILKIVISLTSSIWASPEAAGVITKNNKPIAEGKKLKLEEKQQAKIDKAETAYKDAEKNVKREVKNYVSINADRYQKASIRKLGVDGWICHPSNKDKVDIKLCKNIRLIEDKPIQLKSHYESLLIDPEYDALVKDYTTEIITSGKDFTYQMNRRTGYFIWLDIIALIFGIGAEYMRYIRRKATNTTDKNTPTLFYIFGNWMGGKNKQLLYWLEDTFQVDIDGDGKKGDPTLAKNYTNGNKRYQTSIPITNENNVIPVITDANSDSEANVTNEKIIRYGQDTTQKGDSLNQGKNKSVTNANDSKKANAGIPFIEVEEEIKTIRDIKNSFGNYFNKLGNDDITSLTFRKNISKWLTALAALYKKYPTLNKSVMAGTYQNWLINTEKKRGKLLASKTNYDEKVSIQKELEFAEKEWSQFFSIRLKLEKTFS